MSDTPVAIREGRLRWAYQRLYPGVQAGLWYVAASLTSAVAVGLEPATDRGLSDLHFEFRGGKELEPRPPDARTRREDHPSQ